MNSIFMGIIDDEKIFEKNYININNINIINEEIKEKYLICSKKLKSYSLYFDKISDYTNCEIIDYLLTNGENIEELEITKIDKNSQLSFFLRIIRIKNYIFKFNKKYN